MSGHQFDSELVLSNMNKSAGFKTEVLEDYIDFF